MAFWPGARPLNPIGMDLSDLIAYLSTYVDLSTGFVHALQKDGEVERKHFRNRHRLLEYNSVPPFTYFLEKGFATGRYLEAGREVAAWFVAPKRGITPDGFFSHQLSTESIVLSPGSTVLYLGREYVKQLFLRFPEAEVLARRVLEAYHRESEAEKRILRSLSAADKYAYLVTSRPEIREHAPVGDIASYLGMSRKTCQRIRKNSPN